jgi:SAM-dependent methyltransferase
MEHRDHVRLLAGGVTSPPLPLQAGLGDSGAEFRPEDVALAGAKGEGETQRAVWADLGSGTGAFTLALADLLGPGGEIYSVDRDASALRVQEQAMRARFPQTRVHTMAADFQRGADFQRRLDLPPLDGVVMANSLHYVRDKEPVLQTIWGLLKPGGRFILVEYNSDHGNPWVPYPITYPAWERLASRSGFRETALLAVQPSRFLSQIYSALSYR